MIPKIIHYCWLSEDPVPSEFQMYINTWKKNLPEYAFMQWNFKKFDKESSLWVSEAFDSKKYAFAADYIRLYAIYNYGGIYLDMDVEVLKSFNDFLQLNSMLCFENTPNDELEVAAFGAEKGSPWIKDCMNHYTDRHFLKPDGSFDTTTLPTIVKRTLLSNNYILRKVNNVEEAFKCSGKEIPVFPCEYFSPKSYLTYKMEKTENTYSIHHFSGTWLSTWQKIKLKIHRLIGC